MQSRRRDFVLAGLGTALGAVGLAGCAGKPQAKGPKPVVTRIQVLPVTPPERFYTYNNLITPDIGSMLASNITNRAKSNVFSEKMEAERKALGPKLTAALIEELNRAGYQAEPLEWAGRDPAAPEEIDYEKVPATAPILHAYFSDIGMDSSRLSSYYVPRLNVSVNLVGRGADTDLYSETIYYGADSRGVASWSVPAAERFRFPDYASLLDKTDEVVASYDAGVQAIAKKMAQNLKALY